MHRVHEEGDPQALEECQVLEAVGRRLREARHRTGLSQEAVAHQAGCATRSVTRWETGRCDPGVVMLSRRPSNCDVFLSWLGERELERVRPGVPGLLTAPLLADSRILRHNTCRTARSRRTGAADGGFICEDRREFSPIGAG